MTSMVIAGGAHSHVQYALAEVRSRPTLELRGVFDPDEFLAIGLASEFSAPVVGSLDRLLSAGADIVVCAGVYRDRGAAVVAALEAGAHVLCDKPLCVTLDDLAAITDATQRTGRRVALMLEKRDAPETRVVREAVRDDRLGSPVALASWAPHKLLLERRDPWFLDPATYGGILGDLLVHDIDIALLLTGATHGTVTGWTGASRDSGFALHGGAVVELHGGPRGDAVLTAEVDWLTPDASEIHGDYRMRVVGTGGTAEMYWGRSRTELTTTSQARHEMVLPDPHRPAQDALDALLTGGEGADQRCRDALTVTRIALLAQESALSGGTSFAWKEAAL